MKHRDVLIIDNDLSFVNDLTVNLNQVGLAPQHVKTLNLALELIQQETPEIIISLDEIDGNSIQDLIHKIKRAAPESSLLLVGHSATPEASVQQAVMAIKQGAHQYFLKEHASKQLIEHIQQLIKERQQSSILVDPNNRDVLAQAQAIAKRKEPILIQGEDLKSNTILAQYIHDYSAHSSHPLIICNCSLHSEEDLKELLLGNPSTPNSTNLITNAKNGTLVFEAIDALPMGMQKELIIMLNKSNHDLPRIIATTTTTLKEKVAKKEFNEDLYYYLNVLTINSLPLSERPLDIIPLAEYLLKSLAKSQHTTWSRLTPAAQQKLMQYQWPGNAKELENTLQRAMLLSDSELIDEKHITIENYKLNENIQFSLTLDIKQHEYQLILSTLEKTQGSRKQTSQLLNISPRTLRYKLARMREEGFNIPLSKRQASINPQLNAME
ncbi:MAG: sigma-54-dependent Fis family transcriptional regulator [Legionellales bacterium]|nr:sigma-54-dependent Fis family transcriptional regulator [Legionellales bacterium]